MLAVGILVGGRNSDFVPVQSVFESRLSVFLGDSVCVVLKGELLAMGARTSPSPEDCFVALGLECVVDSLRSVQGVNNLAETTNSPGRITSEDLVVLVDSNRSCDRLTDEKGDGEREDSREMHGEKIMIWSEVAYRSNE
jgi:hypothetical protein